MAYYRPAPDSVVAIVEHVMEAYHEDLLDARIGILFRDEAPVVNGRVKLGAAKKVADDLRPYVPYDFLIWFAEDIWERLSERQRQALADHELQHCSFEGHKASMRKHDIEEFTCIIERHGFWWPGDLADRMVYAVQGALPMPDMHSGAVDAPGRDVLDQLGDILED